MNRQKQFLCERIATLKSSRFECHSSLQKLPRFLGFFVIMADLDAMLDDAADEIIPTVFDLDATLKSTKKIDDVKPWLAFSSNVPVATRDKWSKMVKTDALASVTVCA
jgi:hypothetical protein